jgi:hypothetical protein
MTTMNRAVSIGVFVMAAFNGLFLFGNGLFMVIARRSGFFVPGVITTGLYNQHFVRDIGIIQMFLGVAFGIGMVRPAVRFGMWTAATSWLIAHALFHLWEVTVGICGPSAMHRGGDPGRHCTFRANRRVDQQRRVRTLRPIRGDFARKGSGTV